MKKLIFILLLIVVGCSNVVVHENNGVEELTKGKLKAIDCLDEQRNVDACIEIYQPVCGQVRVECIKEPCDPIKETFENSCFACMNERVISYTEGECLDEGGIKK